jgi:hypothetical protein
VAHEAEGTVDELTFDEELLISHLLSLIPYDGALSNNPQVLQGRYRMAWGPCRI